jgi:uncharacterized damage-inducible protein DinB
MTHSYLLMAQNNAWANQTLFQAMTSLSKDEFCAKQPGFFPSICATMNHTYEVDLYYIDALFLGGNGVAVFDRVIVEDPKNLAKEQAKADAKLIHFCQVATPQTFNEQRSFIRNDDSMQESVTAILLHLFQHQIHHRGQAHVQLQTAGIAPPQLDEFHLDFERASTAQKSFK